MFTLNAKGKLISSEKTMLMGIVNITPDSFFEGSRVKGDDAILHRVEQMLTDGADMIDIGGQSTRPGSKKITEEEELKRVVDAIAKVNAHFPETLISIDTYYAKVAQEAVYAGASLVNDISGGDMDVSMLQVVGTLQVPYICMHMKGTPQTMQQEPVYDNVTKEVLDFFIQKSGACKRAGIHDVIIDPGFGFGKTASHNFELLKNLGVFKIVKRPVLVGISRKATIYKTLGIAAAEALNGTTVLNTIGLLNGADILRVHDVKEAKEAITLVAAYRK